MTRVEPLAFHTYLVPHFPTLHFGAVFSRPAFSVVPSAVAVIADRTAYDVRYTDKLTNQFR